MAAPQTHDFAQANKDHFDATAHKYDDTPGALQMAREVGRAMRNAYPFDEDTTTVMDYACGTGLISRELAPYAKRIVGVDISSGMVEQYNKRVENQGILPEEMSAVRLELAGREEELEGEKFDVIVCAVAYHHLASIKDTTRILSFFLKPGGVLLVMDILGDENTNKAFTDDVAHLVAHKHGFKESDIQNAYEGAGLDLVSFTEVTSAKMHGQMVHFFLAKGVKGTKST